MKMMMTRPGVIGVANLKKMKTQSKLPNLFRSGRQAPCSHRFQQRRCGLMCMTRMSLSPFRCSCKKRQLQEAAAQSCLAEADWPERGGMGCL